ncbi:MAG: 23S rRNA (uracil(1939)-C(5))-methyltransferase RlmD [Lachnospiraceae bacterium]|nr:23S rRNA (uracil(1939)-C(5))-methyltransferase RlmD [Lachnospiraceae bacterium]
MGNGTYKKNDIVTVTIEDVGNDGEGIGKVDGYTLFVKDAVIGDTVKARITKCKKNYGYARVEKVVTPSSFRVEPKCRFHRQCGGCQIQAMSYERQLAFKQEKVRNNLIRIGGFAVDVIDSIMEPIVGMEEPWNYRNKAQYPVGYDKNGDLVVGFYAGRTHDIIANTDCALGAKENRIILEAVLDYMRENNVTAYCENDGTGLVRHVLIRTGFASGQIMVCLVINGKKLPAENKLVEELIGLELGEVEFMGSDTKDDCVRRNAVQKRIVSIAVSVNEERTNVIMGKEIRTLWGSERIEDSIRVLRVEADTGVKVAASGNGFVETGEEVTYCISPLSFYQVNPRQTEKLYGLALDYAGLTGSETVWDLYCGIGTISLFMAKRAKQVYGVEVISQAIEDAKENARINGIDNVQFYVGKAEEVLPAFYEKDAAGESVDEQMRHPDVIVVDPPRKGCDEKCLETMLAMKPERIVYVSCDSATLARDLKILAEGGYELKKVRAVDQFGHSVHVECVVMMQYKY